MAFRYHKRLTRVFINFLHSWYLLCRINLSKFWLHMLSFHKINLFKFELDAIELAKADDSSRRLTKKEQKIVNLTPGRFLNFVATELIYLFYSKI